MNIIVDGFKVIKNGDGDIVLFDYQITDNNKISICAIMLGDKRNKFLCCYPGKLHINNSHYITGKDLIFFSKLMCVENELTNITGCCNNLCCNIKSLFKR